MSRALQPSFWLSQLSPLRLSTSLGASCVFHLKQTQTSLHADVKRRFSGSRIDFWRRPDFWSKRHLQLNSARSSSGLSTAERRQRWATSVGAEPGAGGPRAPRNENEPADPEVSSDIKVIDYSRDQIVEHSPPQSSLADFLQNQPKPEWASCRWIYVNGLNYDVVRCLGERQKLHRLAIEDVLDSTASAKVDWYDNHCFLEMPLQKLVDIDMPEHPRQLASPLDDDLMQDLSRLRHSPRKVPKWHTFWHGKFGISVEQTSIFLTSDNTVITIFERSGDDILRPILTRLNSPETIVRSSNEPSMLVQAVVDAVVDLSLPIGKAVSEAFNHLELAVLMTPEVQQSKQLYILRSGLTHFMDNTLAVGSLVKMLCDHRALTAAEPSQSDSAVSKHPRTPVNTVSIAPITQIYLQDVQDHIRALSSSTHMSIRSAENLTSLIFNTIAASQNESVRQLTLISSFFLPLTFLTGYFGMNFDPMPVVNNHSDAFFWALAAPVMLFTATLLILRSRRVTARRSVHRWNKQRPPPRNF